MSRSFTGDLRTEIGEHVADFIARTNIAAMEEQHQHELLQFAAQFAENQAIELPDQSQVQTAAPRTLSPHEANEQSETCDRLCI